MSRDRAPHEPEPFPAVDRAAWQERAAEELGSGDRGLLSGAPGAEGIVLRPLYTAEDAPAPDAAGFPGLPPFTRGAALVPRAGHPWEICPRHDACGAESLARAAAEDLKNGADGLWLRLGRAARLGFDTGDGGALCALPLGEARLILDAGGNALPLAACVSELLRKRGVLPERARLMFFCDPLGALAQDGLLPCSLARAEEQLVVLARQCARSFPGARAAVASTLPYHLAGASAQQELGFALATTAHYLRRFVAGGLSAAEGLGQIAWSLAAGRDFFTGLSKMRAARLAFGLLGRACACDRPPPTWLHAVTSERALARRDPWVNMLRATSEALAAACGGADALTCLAFDAALGEPEDLGRTIARNTQTILAEESRIGRVMDPAGGSYYVETLTRDLARAAWSVFQEIERKGGMAECLAGGFIRASVDASWRERHLRLVRRQEPVTGVSEFPDEEELLERRPRPEAAPPDALLRRIEELRAGSDLEPLPDLWKAPDVFAACVEAAASGASCAAISAALAGGAPLVRLEPLPARRDAALFEELRDAADRLAAAAGRPRAYLACLGPPAEHGDRAAFMRNLFLAGGFHVTADEGTGDLEPEEAAAAAAGRFAASGARVACLCGAERRYATSGAAAARALKEAGAARVLVAGRPGDLEADLRSAGVDRFAFAGMDACELLGTLLLELGGKLRGGE
ncbi:MAG: methylmalonyl-CoA mutase [Planctomycetes bacterium]|nr:methylmalonyl-CoA mutase [Planctomycetota bacterium]